MSRKREKAEPVRQLENEKVIITEWRFSPGAETGWHVHEHDYVVVPLTSGRLLLETLNGEVAADLVVGQSYSREVGTEHNVINDNAFNLSFVEIELK
jgi:quercetin dioxygenase-like cupin family protein